MACFLVSAAEAAIVTACAKVIEKKEKDLEVTGFTASAEEPETITGKAAEAKISKYNEAASGTPFSRKLKWLSTMLWGGSALLALEHLWHGEIVPWFPFLTAAKDPADTMEMLQEMATVGVGMAALVTAVWLGMVVVTALIERKAAVEAPETLPVKN